MKTFNYSYTHRYGTGMGTVEALNEESAKKKVTEGITIPKEVGGEFDEKGKLVGAKKTGGKLENLEITLEDVTPTAE